MTDPEMTAVDAALDEAARVTPAVPDDLMAAVLRDAAGLQPAVAAPQVRLSLWESLMDLVGGWPAMGGLAAAGVAGVWLGAAPPIGLETAAADLFGATEAIDLFGTDILAGFDVAEDAQ